MKFLSVLGLFSRFTTNVKAHLGEALRPQAGKGEELLLFSCLLSYKLVKELISPANTDLGETQGRPV